MAAMLVLVLGVYLYFKPPWFSDLTLESTHYICYSTATREHTKPPELTAS